MKISVIVVSLNPGDELLKTVNSILEQDYHNFEIIIKDGGSTDGSVQKLPEDDRINLYVKPDVGIYDAMNQALEVATGDYVYFLNCGDYLYDKQVLKTVAWNIAKTAQDLSAKEDMERPMVVYGDIYDRMGNTRITSNPIIDEFACYRNVPCHQACIYDRQMLLMHPFRLEYKVRADYEQFLWCFFIAKSHMIHMDRIIASYMGGGFSETKANKKLSEKEHIEIVENYMPHRHVVRYRWRMRLSMAGLRGVLARNPVTSGMYNQIKAKAYSKRG